MLISLQVNNPDMRVAIIRDYAKKHFMTTPLLDYALEVATAKVSLVSCDHHVMLVGDMYRIIYGCI